MPVKNHESILFTVDKLLEDSTEDSGYRRINRYVFRTHEEAADFRDKRQKRTKKYLYDTPVRSEWGAA